MVKRANINWNAKQLYKMVHKRTITFDNVVQRGFVWKTDRSSLLIHSMLTGWIPVPPFYMVRGEQKDYDAIDGQQRCLSVHNYFDGQFPLTGIPEVEMEKDDGTTVNIDVNGMYYNDLPEELRDTLDSYSLTIYYFENITDDQIAEMFFRLNNGKPLSAIELTRVKAKSMAIIKELGQHELFQSALTKKALERYTNEDIVIKTYAMLHEKEPSLETKVIRPLMESVELTENDVKQMSKIYSRILAIHKGISENGENTPKENAKIAKRIITRTHMISIVPIINQSIEEDRSVDDMVKLFSKFYEGKKSASISETYNNYAGSGSAKKEAVRKRLDELRKSYTEFFTH